MSIEAFDTCFFRCQAEHRVFNNMVRYTSGAKFTTELRVLSNRKTTVAGQHNTFSIRQLILKFSNDSLFLRQICHYFVTPPACLGFIKACKKTSGCVRRR